MHGYSKSDYGFEQKKKISLNQIKNSDSDDHLSNVYIYRVMIVFYNNNSRSLIGLQIYLPNTSIVLRPPT
ncbi:hypothetical protein DERP_011503 [Dermatophagoides pteronyssinus]|uniref:Uncharacterized protein n=1 Tax=Dermatophagoides pteronyssinus TaxID=6956 RepID=A0ABQ8JC41_DERPT|nr:hypothetical protein DERP_011503 [Dermatophagoides pteronyssinus]